ncbi:unnamed protein product [Orchesella dallaii]|uniref:Inositol polyphosphate 1-phosphatase n=1 Tax=Orchesella dallaii TaxID=48710 RepID=A0ABP1R3G4_9HEXA
MSELVRVLLAASEKAANIARLIRAETKLFSLLVQEKKGEERNERFVRDFKTLADVLIQESLRHDIGEMYPDMKDNIYGEESNTFSNALGATITVKVEDTPELTAKLLSQVLDGDMDAAKLLAEEVHREIKLDERETSLLPHDLIETYENIGIWIDPIDATNEYIKGSEEFDKICHENLEEEDQVWSAGLHCVTVLIGAFYMNTGQPIIGVINQPFWKYDAAKQKWNGRFFWGLSLGSHSVSTLTRYPLPRNEDNFPKRHTVILSSSEDKALKDKLKTKFNTISSAGAGYKLLCVALGLADVYLLSKDSVHLWDLCGPHCILNSLGGGIYSYKNYCQDSEQVPSGKQCRISYDPHQESNGKEGNFVIKGGILGFRDVQIAASVRECILADIPMTPCYEERETVPDYSDDA